MTTPNKQAEPSANDMLWNLIAAGRPHSLTTTYRYETRPASQMLTDLRAPYITDSPGLNKWAGLLTEGEWEYQCSVE